MPILVKVNYNLYDMNTETNSLNGMAVIPQIYG